MASLSLEASHIWKMRLITMFKLIQIEDLIFVQNGTEYKVNELIIII